MKLTKTMKDAIVRAIMADIPKPGRNLVVAEMQAALVKGMSRDCKRLYHTSPKALATVYVYASHYPVDFGTSLIIGDAREDESLAPWQKMVSDRASIANKLSAALHGVKTRKQFVDTFPEFIKYAPPEDGVCPTLPAVANVVPDLVKLGWAQTVFQE